MKEAMTYTIEAAEEVHSLAEIAVHEAREEVVRVRGEEVASLDLPFEDRERIRSLRHWREDDLAAASARRHRIVNALAEVERSLRVLARETEDVAHELSFLGYPCQG